MLLGAISKELDKIVEFAAFEDFISFDRKGKNKVKRVVIKMRNCKTEEE